MDYDVMSGTYSWCVFEALVIQHAKRMRQTESTIFYHINSKLHDFRRKRKFLNIYCVLCTDNCTVYINNYYPFLSFTFLFSYFL